MRTKLLLSVVMVALFGLFSCTKNEDIKVYDVAIKLTLEDGIETEGRVVKLSNGSNIFEVTTDASGIAMFKVPVGLYEATTSFVAPVDGAVFNFNGTKTGINVTEAWNGATSIEMEFEQSVSGSLLIKELYFGGITKESDGKSYAYDRYVVLYNNTDYELSLDNLCFGAVNPYNSTASNKDYVDGVLSYSDVSVCGPGIWYFPNNVTVPARGEITIAFNAAIDHSATYTNSVDLSNVDYVGYDTDVYNHSLTYPAPSENIPTSNYLKAIHYGSGSAWILSGMSPAFFIFQIKEGTPVEFVADENTTHYYGGEVGAFQTRKAIPNAWVLDGIEVFLASGDDHLKRLTSDVDAGILYFTSKQGFTAYRNVDKEATEAIAENKGKLVYNYALGTDNIEGISKGTTDPSGIDAEASMKNGAIIVYADTNNSTNDFHQRKISSLK